MGKALELNAIRMRKPSTKQNYPSDRTQRQDLEYDARDVGIVSAGQRETVAELDP